MGYYKALNYSFLLLKYRSRAKKELIERLKAKNFSITDISKVIKYLSDQGYIDDENFVLEFINEKLAKGFGRRKISFDLLRLGVELKLIDDKLNSINKKKYMIKIKDILAIKEQHCQNEKNKQRKAFNYLKQRGFTADEINQALNDNG